MERYQDGFFILLTIFVVIVVVVLVFIGIKDHEEENKRKEVKKIKRLSFWATILSVLTESYKEEEGVKYLYSRKTCFVMNVFLLLMFLTIILSVVFLFVAN